MNDRDTAATALHMVLTGLAFPESPRWHDDRLWLADWAAHELIAVVPIGTREVVRPVPFIPFTFSFDWLPDGRLLIVSGSEQPLVRQETDGSLVPHADLSNLGVKGWNELVVDGRGNAYLNCIGFNMMIGEEPAPGSIALVTPDGSARLVAGGLAFPNGMAVTPDNTTLIVAESYRNQLTAFAIEDDGSLSNQRTWAAVDDYHPDGICLDADGAVWFADVASKQCVRVHEGGEVLQTVTADRGCFACMLGGADGATLFAVTREWQGMRAPVGESRTGQVVAAPAPSPHAGWP